MATPVAVTHRRDRFIDLLRVLAIGVVVVEHWLFPVLAYDPVTRSLDVGNALATPGAWVTTWVGQVMPLVFFAGGAANAMSLRRGTTRAWLGERLRRLGWPVLPLAAVWLPLPAVLVGLGVPAQPVAVAAAIAGQLLWFLAAYLLAVVLAPLLTRADARFGLAIPAALAVAAVGVDAIRFAGATWVGFLNVAFVWLAVHQLGIAYANGRLERVRGVRAAGLGAAGLAAAALLVTYGPYPASMVGLPGAPASNVAPPSVALLALAMFQVGAALLLRDGLTAWAGRPRPGRLLDWAGPRAMTIYLWHMPALVLVAGVLVVWLGIPTPPPGSAGWWAGVPFWLGALAAVLAALVSALARFERPPRSRATAPPTGRRLALAVAAVAAGLLALTVAGFGDPTWSLPAALALAVGLAVSAPTASR